MTIVQAKVRKDSDGQLVVLIPDKCGFRVGDNVEVSRGGTILQLQETIDSYQRDY